MPQELPHGTILDALHDGTIVALRDGEDGSLLAQVEIEYLADVLEAGSTTVSVRFSHCSSPTWTAYDSEPVDPRTIQDLQITLFSVSKAGEGDTDGLTLDCAEGQLQLSCSAIEFMTESGAAVTGDALKRASRLYWERWSARGLAGKLGLHVRPGVQADLPVMRSLYTELLQVLATYNTTVDPANELQGDWVEKPGQLFTYIVERKDSAGNMHPVALALVMGKAYVEALGGTSDFWMYEFVVTERERRGGIGRASLALVLDAHEGSWCLDVLPDNEPAMGFWAASLAHFEPRTYRRTDDEGVEFERFEFETRLALT